MTVGGFEITGVASLHAPDGAVINHPCAFDGMVVILIGDRQRVEGFEDLSAKLILRVVYQHRRQRVAAIGELFLRLRREGDASEEQQYESWNFNH